MHFSMQVLIPQDVLVREVEGESVILNLNSESYFGLDNVGTRFLSVLSTTNSIQEAYDTLINEYEVDPDVLRHDLTNLIEKLAQLGIIELKDEERL